MLKTLILCIFVTTGLSGVGSAQGIRKDLPPRLQPKNIITSFHRRAANSDLAPWRSVGRVNVGGTAHCSGTLVAPDVVLTAAHCLYSPERGGMVAPNIVHFLAGYSKGEFKGHSKVKSYIYGEDFDGAAGAVVSNLQHDWALLRLTEALGKDLGYLRIPRNWTAADTMDASMEHAPIARSIDGSRKLELDPQITTAGYPGDRAHILSLEEGCTINGVAAQGRVLFTSCIAIKGDSGGPILQKTEAGDWAVIGLQTASTEVANRHSSIGVSALTYQHRLVDLVSSPADDDTLPDLEPTQP